MQCFILLRSVVSKEPNSTHICPFPRPHDSRMVLKDKFRIFLRATFNHYNHIMRLGEKAMRKKFEDNQNTFTLTVAGCFVLSMSG